MSTTDTDINICARALLTIGANPISSFEDESVEGQVADQFYPTVYRNLLEMHPWGFAKKSAALAKKAGTPNTGYEFAYELPSDFLVALNTRPRGHRYEIIGNAIHTNTDDTDPDGYVLEYIHAVQEVNLPAYFVQALIDRLAYVFAYPITRDLKIEEQRLAISEQSSATAMWQDSRQWPQERVLATDDFIAARYSTSSSGILGV